MDELIGKQVIIVTKRNKVYNKSLLPIFPEHTLSASVENIIGDFIKISNILIISCDSNNKKYGRNKNLIARDKLFEKNNFNDFLLIKIKNNLYFEIKIYVQNTNLLKSIQKQKQKQNISSLTLFNICFYKLSTEDLHILNENLCIF